MTVDQTDKVVKFHASSPAYDSEKTLKSGELGMIEQSAMVVSVEAGYAWVMPQQKAGGCSSCSSGSTCSSSSPFDFLNKAPQKIRVLNPLYARPGEQVIVGMQGEALVVYSLLAYLMPLLGLIFAAILGHVVFLFLGLDAEIGAVMAGIAGLFAGLHIANVFSLRSLHSSKFQPVILRTKEQLHYGHIIPSP
jgi:sigma-E factor negative regulatory protein RseC